MTWSQTAKSILIAISVLRENTESGSTAESAGEIVFKYRRIYHKFEYISHSTGLGHLIVKLLKKQDSSTMSRTLRREKQDNDNRNQINLWRPLSI